MELFEAPEMSELAIFWKQFLERKLGPYRLILKAAAPILNATCSK